MPAAYCQAGRGGVTSPILSQNAERPVHNAETIIPSRGTFELNHWRMECSRSAYTLQSATDMNEGICPDLMVDRSQTR